jgi:hypothetical protein
MTDLSDHDEMPLGTDNEEVRSSLMQTADATPLHPPGTFAKNTQIGDVVNGVANQLGVKPPKNIIKFPGRK